MFDSRFSSSKSLQRLIYIRIFSQNSVKFAFCLHDAGKFKRQIYCRMVRLCLKSVKQRLNASTIIFVPIKKTKVNNRNNLIQFLRSPTYLVIRGIETDSEGLTAVSANLILGGGM